jgi:hypothetical protein
MMEEGTVSRVQEIEEQLRALSGAELRDLRAWLDDYENQLGTSSSKPNWRPESGTP